MNEADKNQAPSTNMEKLKLQSAACGPGCDCGCAPSRKTRWIVGAVIIVVAGILVARAAMKDDGSGSQPPSSEFTSPVTSTGLQATGDSADETSSGDAASSGAGAVVCGRMLPSLDALNDEAADKEGVFVFLAGADAAKNREIAAEVEKAAATLRARDINMGVFTLQADSEEHAEIARQVPPPSVLTLVKGRGAAAVSSGVTEMKLLQAFVAASSGGGCGSSCGSSGCR